MLRLNPMNLQASGTRSVIGAIAERPVSRGLDEGDMSPPAFFNCYKYCRRRQLATTPDYPQIRCSSPPDVCPPPLLIVRSNARRCSDTFGRDQSSRDSWASKFAVPLADARQKVGRIADCIAVAYGRFRLCHIPCPAENRPFRARSWHVFYLAFLFGSLIFEVFAISTVRHGKKLAVFAAKAADCRHCSIEDLVLQPRSGGKRYWT